MQDYLKGIITSTDVILISGVFRISVLDRTTLYILEVGGGIVRNNILSPPTLYKQEVYIDLLSILSIFINFTAG